MTGLIEDKKLQFRFYDYSQYYPNLNAKSKSEPASSPTGAP